MCAGQRREAPCPRLPYDPIASTSLRSATLQFTTAGLDPVVHADLSAEWIAGSSMHSGRPKAEPVCPAMTRRVSAVAKSFSPHKLSAFTSNNGTRHAPHPRQLPVRRRRIRDHRAADGAAELPLLAMPQAAWRRVSQPRARAGEGFPLAQGRASDQVL
jgi:hypothetical protein